MDTKELTEIVKRALWHPLASVGQLSVKELQQLEAAVREGQLSKGKERTGGYSGLKTVYARAGYSFVDGRRITDTRLTTNSYRSRMHKALDCLMNRQLK